jgi:pyridoxine 5-phosphate synthase
LSGFQRSDGRGMTLLSVNLNKVALIRNARASDFPSVREAAEICVEAGAGGITLHPRPDERHARRSDVREVAAFVKHRARIELNVEGNPTPEFLELVEETLPTQCTLVPDAPTAKTSDHGWDLAVDGRRLRPIVRRLRALGIRVSLFLEPLPEQIERAKDLGADRIELYTESYARAFDDCDCDAELERYAAAGRVANDIGLGVNAGHDLDLENVGVFCRTVPRVLEVSIGHALVSDAFAVGLRQAVRDYVRALHGGERAART